jgi:hypothetical protein
MQYVNPAALREGTPLFQDGALISGARFRGGEHCHRTGVVDGHIQGRHIDGIVNSVQVMPLPSVARPLHRWQMLIPMHCQSGRLVQADG